MNRVTKECRSNSKLPGLVDLFLFRPLVTVPLGAKLLKVTPKAVDLMLAQLGEPARGSSPAAPSTVPGVSYSKARSRSWIRFRTGRMQACPNWT
jgi:hypothetical protein